MPAVRTSSLMLSVLASFSSQLGYCQSLSEQIDALIAKELPQATVGVYIKNTSTGDVIYSKNADKLLAPASSTKLFTTAAALYQLQANYHFFTTLSQKNNDFYLTFNGSPSLTEKNLRDLLLNLTKEGHKNIAGNIIIDASRYPAPYYPGGTSYDDLGWYYAAPVSAAIINGNAIAYEFKTGEKAGDLVHIKPKSQNSSLTIINQLVTANKEEAKDHCSLHVAVKPNNTLRLFGCMVSHKNPKIMELAVTNPTLLVKQIIKQFLSEHEITLKGSIITGKTPTDAKIIARYQSGDLIKMLAHMLKESDNLYANSLTRELGFALTQQASQTQGLFAMKKILAKHTHLDMKQLELADGMGTRYNLATPEQMVVLLSDLYNDNTINPYLKKMLPQAGVSGTLKDRMKKSILEKKVYAKTGTMHDMSSLSGFILNPKDTLVFSIIINGVNKPIFKAKQLEEKILIAVENASSH